MATRANAQKKTYSGIDNSEMKPVALFYKSKLTATGVLALFTAKDADVDGGWVTDFEAAITAVGNIVPSKTIIQINKDIANNIKLNSKKSVAYGKVLSYFLEKTFPDQPGLVASFPIVAANDKMRLGDTEGFLYEVNTIISQIKVPANKAALEAKNWPVSNLADYEALMSTVEGLNTQQEQAKQLVPENTDAAQVVRNTCYGFIKTLLQLKDMVYEGNKLKQHEWALATILNQINGGGSGGGEVLAVREGDVSSPGIETVEIDSVGEGVETVRGTVTNGGLRFFASATTDGVPQPESVLLDVTNSSFEKTLAEFIAAVGLDAGRPILRVQNIGMTTAHYALVFKG